MAVHSIVIYSLDPLSQARFWSLATGMPPVDIDAAYLSGEAQPALGEAICLTDGTLRLWLTPPDDPPPLAGRVHVDVSGDRALVDALVDAGATLQQDTHEGVVLLDPEGNPFCVVIDD